LGNEKQSFEKQVSNYGSYSNGYAYGYNNNTGGTSNNWVSKQPLSPIEIKKRVMTYFQKKYGISDDEFMFLYDGLHYYLDDFNGQKSINEVIKEYKESPFFY
jgi:hypothetical protein